jgi:hypothetical protein
MHLDAHFSYHLPPSTVPDITNTFWEGRFQEELCTDKSPLPIELA